MDRLADLNTRLREETERFRAAGRDPHDAFRGLYITEGEIDASVAEMGRGTGEPTAGSLVADRLADLVDRFGLSQFESEVLLACVAPELDLRYERIYAYLQDDVSRKRPTVDLLLRILCRDARQRREARASFASDAPLRRRQLIAKWDGGDAAAPLLANAVEADGRVVAYLLGSDAMAGSLLPFASAVTRRPAAAGPAAAARLARAAEVVAGGVERLGRRALVVVSGASGSGKRLLAAEICRRLGRGTLEVETGRLLRAELPPVAAVRAVFREAGLRDAIVYWAGADLLWSDGERAVAAREALEDELEQWSDLVLLAGPWSWEAPVALAGRQTLRLGLPILDPSVRLEIWRELLGGATAALPEAEAGLHSLAAGFRFTPGQMQEALTCAHGLAASRDPDATPTVADLQAGCRMVSSRGLATLGHELRPKAAWGDIVLPEDSLDQLHELCATVRHRGIVLHRWGFDARLSAGIGTSALFTGPPGTGKTMAAEIVAGDLGVALFRIDLAGVVSKWVGETEKNLDRVFQAAEHSNAILLFDEADALFGKRSEVKDSHDRYANLEISYLLQKMETYDGVAILATNMRRQLDEAFLRRLTFHVSFSMPDEEDRIRIWQAAWPPELPRAEDVDLAALGRFKLAGGNIKNIVLAAAYLAAGDGDRVTMAHLFRAVRREYQKLGKQEIPTQGFR